MLGSGQHKLPDNAPGLLFMPLSELRFLVVDDHDFQRSMLIRMLKRLGAVQIGEAADGAAALKVCGSTPIDIIICDLDMPGMDGMAFIRHLGESGINASMILSSALDRSLVASVGTMTRAYGIHLLGCVEKPTTLERLQALIGLYKTPTFHELGIAPPTFSLDEICAGLAAGQFEPFFQPKVEIASGELKGVEALARWRHPEHGIVAPQSFIETLEGSGLIDELSWQMIELSARWCHEWRAADLDINVSVNVSLSSLNKASFADRIAGLVNSQKLDPRHMILEVTESTAMTNVGQALENLARLRIKGFGLSIDDYGTGYSSMQQLTRISFTELKIDQSFVTDASANETCRVVLETSLDMAKKLRLCSVAEGVETEADWAMLQASSCNLAQGYLIGRPMEGKDLLGWVSSWKPPCGMAQALE